MDAAARDALAALAAEMFDTHQSMRDQIQVAKNAATAMGRLRPSSPFPDSVADATKRLTALVQRAESAIETYVALASVGPVTAA